MRVEFIKDHLIFTGEDSPMANLTLSVMVPSPNLPIFSGFDGFVWRPLGKL
jgi:hypothetical protein